MLPFPARVSPYTQELQEDEYSWAQLMLSDPDALDFRRFRAMKTYLFTAYVYPDGLLRQLDLTHRWMVWGFLLDDVLASKPFAADSQRVEAYVAPILAAHDDKARTMDLPAVQENPFALAFARFWQEMQPLTSPLWRERFLAHDREWLRSCSWESSNRAKGRTPDEQEYRTMRLTTAGAYMTTDLLEFCIQTEIPKEIYESKASQRLLRHALGAMCWDNDLASWGKEKVVGEVNNLVPVLQQSRSWTQQEAVEAARELIAIEVKHFAQAGADLIEQYQQHESFLQRYIMGVRSMLAGVINWHQISDRYLAQP